MGHGGGVVASSRGSTAPTSLGATWETVAEVVATDDTFSRCVPGVGYIYPGSVVIGVESLG